MASSVHQVGAALDLAVVLAAALAVLMTRRAAAGWALAVVSALWPVVNNGLVEGPVLLTVDRLHGITVADLVAVAGFVLAGWALWYACPPGRRWLRFAGLVVLALAGMAAAYAFQN